MKAKIIILFLIILIGFSLRVFKIDNIPPSLTWDEVAWGYNAYSLGIDGKDEFGIFMPYKYLESFGDFKPPMYAYLDILPIRVFGLTEFAVRLPSAIFGVVAVLLTYFLTREIFYNFKRREFYAVISCAILAFSPWHINLSRAAFEANVASTFLIFGVFMFLIAVRRNLWLLSLSALSFSLTFYIFNTSRIVAPMLAIVLFLFFFKKIIKKPIETGVAIVIGVLILLPIVGFLFSPQANLRFREVNIFTDISVIEQSNQEISNDGNSSFGKIIHNRRLKYSVSFLSHYFDNLSPAFLFIKGDGNPKFSTQDVGEIYLVCLPFLLIGIIFLFRRREGIWWFIPVWLLLGIIPAATARETPHALRIETVLPTFQILISYGAVTFYFYLKDKVRQKTLFSFIIGFIVFLYALNILYYLYGYYVHYARERSGEWQYGYREALQYTHLNEEKYHNVYFTNVLGRPYIYYLFYNKIKPNEFRKKSDVSRDAFGFVNVARIGKYHFLKDEEMPKDKNSLYVGQPYDAPENAKILKTINKLNGERALIIYTY